MYSESFSTTSLQFNCSKMTNVCVIFLICAYFYCFLYKIAENDGMVCELDVPKSVLLITLPYGILDVIQWYQSVPQHRKALHEQSLRYDLLNIWFFGQDFKSNNNHRTSNQDLETIFNLVKMRWSSTCIARRKGKIIRNMIDYNDKSM